MMKKDLFKMFTGEYEEGRSFRTSAKWVKENDWDVFEQLQSMADGTFHDDWLVEYAFNEIDGEIEVVITAGEDWQMLNNQPAWIHEVLPLDEFLEAYEHEKYIEQLK